MPAEHGGQSDNGQEDTATAQQKAPAEWVEGLVQQMSGARDMGDARTRAANELRSFEQAVMQTTNKARFKWRFMIPPALL